METVSGITRHVLPGSTMKRGENVNVFWLDAGGGVLVDVGWDSEESFAALRQALPHPPRVVLLTHIHPDHAGGIRRVAEWCNPVIYLPFEDRALSGFPLPEQARPFKGEEPLQLNGLEVRVLHTPGHTPGHRCLYFPHEGGLVTGDMVLGEGSTWVGPPHGDMTLYMQSLERLLTVGHRFLCPGHGTIQTDPLQKIHEFLAHRRDRERQVLEALAAGANTAPDIVERNYTDTPRYLHSLAELVVVAHLQKLERDGRVHKENETYHLR